ncbi:MAG: sulfatase [Candidatus Pacebacteria bacterium]|nr:sulfatase [Candidatus Paceibacterota bacterium]
MTKPNILYIHSHDTGRYIQPYGHAIPSPNLQRLAEEGVLFRKCFCVGPTCSPSRAGLLTGQYPHQNGMLGLAHRGFRMHDYGKHLVHALRHGGYKSYLSGLQHIHEDAEKIGYDEVISDDINDPQVAAVDFLEQRQEGPWFLSVGFALCHRGFEKAGPAEDPRYTLMPAPLPDSAHAREDMADFKASVRAWDNRIGDVLGALDRSGQADSTLVICTTDHGIAFPGMKCTLTDHGIGVLLIMRAPREFSGGTVIDGMVSHLDVYPTLCELAGVDKPAWLEGFSMLSLLRGEKNEIRDEVHAEINYHAAYEPARCVRTQRYKYIRYFDNRSKPVLVNVAGGPSKEERAEAGWNHREPESEGLYDLLFDPNEAHNLAGNPEYVDVLADMRTRLRHWMESTDDELLSGRIPAPPEAMLNSVDEERLPGELHTASELGLSLIHA